MFEICMIVWSDNIVEVYNDDISMVDITHMMAHQHAAPPQFSTRDTRTWRCGRVAFFHSASNHHEHSNESVVGVAGATSLFTALRL